MEDADVLLAIGTTIGEVTSNYFTFAPKGQLIQIDAEPRVLGSNYPSLGIHADAALALDAIAYRLPAPSVPAESSAGAAIAADLRARVEARIAAQGLDLEVGFLKSIRAAVPDDMPTFWDMT